LFVNVAEKLSPRPAANIPQDKPTLHTVEVDYVPGLTPVETVSRVTALPPPSGDEIIETGYVENRIITPSMYRQKHKEQVNGVQTSAPLKEFGTQTGKQCTLHHLGAFCCVHFYS
jgi:hypothetical protein